MRMLTLGDAPTLWLQVCHLIAQAEISLVLDEGTAGRRGNLSVRY